MADRTDAEILADIAAVLPQATTPPALRHRLESFAAAAAEPLRDFRTYSLALAAGFIDDQIKAGSAEREIVDRVMASALILNAAFVLRAMKLRQSEPFSAARFALIAYDCAQQIAGVPEWDEAAERYEAMMARAAVGDERAFADVSDEAARVADAQAFARRMMAASDVSDDDPDTPIASLLAGCVLAGRIIERAAARGVRACRVCGCTEHRACVEVDGPCGWAATDLCTACAPFSEAVARADG